MIADVPAGVVTVTTAPPTGYAAYTAGAHTTTVNAAGTLPLGTITAVTPTTNGFASYVNLTVQSSNGPQAVFCTAFPIGLYWAVVSPTRRSIQDTVLRTQVLYDWPEKKVALAHPMAVPGASPVVPSPRSSVADPQQ